MALWKAWNFFYYYLKTRNMLHRYLLRNQPSSRTPPDWIFLYYLLKIALNILIIVSDLDYPHIWNNEMLAPKNFAPWVFPAQNLWDLKSFRQAFQNFRNDFQVFSRTSSCLRCQQVSSLKYRSLGFLSSRTGGIRELPLRFYIFFPELTACFWW